jgi:hypothetical protein
MKKYMLILTMVVISISCQQPPLEWTENKDSRIVNTRWFNEDFSDFWEFDSIMCKNKRMENDVYDSLGPYSMTMQW